MQDVPLHGTSHPPMSSPAQSSPEFLCLFVIQGKGSGYMGCVYVVYQKALNIEDASSFFSLRIKAAKYLCF